MFEIALLENRKYHDLNPVFLGRESCAPAHSFGPALRINYLIHYVIKGGGTLYSPKGNFSVKSGQLFLIKPGEVNTYTADRDDPWEYIWIEFNGEAASKLDEIKIPVISCDGTPFINMWEALKREEFREEYIISNLFLLLPLLFDSHQPNRFTTKIQTYILTNYMYDIKIEELAKSMGYSRQHISRAFKNEMGMTIQQFLVDTRLQNSKKLLKRGFSVSETAYMCGYNDVFNFSKGFKQKYMVSPAFWKKQVSEDFESL